MKRDMELIRKIVLAMESGSGSFDSSSEIEGYSREQIGYHCYILIQGGLAEGTPITSDDHKYPEARINNLTWNGHEFADAVRNQTTWTQAISLVKEKSDTVTIGVLMQVLAALAKTAIGIP